MAVGSAILSSSISPTPTVIVSGSVAGSLNLNIRSVAVSLSVPQPLPDVADPYYATPNPVNEILGRGFPASWDPNPAQTFEGWKIGPQIRGLHQSKLQHMGYPAELWQPSTDGPTCSCVKETNQSAVRECPSCFGVGKLPGFNKFLHKTTYFDHSEFDEFVSTSNVELNRSSKPNRVTLIKGAFSGSFVTQFKTLENGPVSQNWEVDVRFKTPNQGTVNVEFSTDGINFYHLSQINGPNRPVGNSQIQFRVTLTRSSTTARSPEFSIIRVRRQAYENVNFDIVRSRECTRNPMSPGDILVLWDWQSTTPVLSDAQGVVREEVKKVWTAPLDFFDVSISADTPPAAIKDLQAGPHPFLKFKTGIEAEHIFVLTQGAYSEQLHVFSYQSFQARRPQRDSEIYDKVEDGYTFEYPPLVVPAIPATASSIARLRDGVWCPGINIIGEASSSATLSTFAYGSFYGIASTLIQLTGSSNGLVTIYAQASGHGQLTSSSNGDVIVFAEANGSMSLLGTSEATTDVPAVADSLGPLVGEASATVITDATAEGISDLEGESDGDITLLRAEAEGDMELDSESEGDITLLRAEAEADMELDSEAGGDISRIEAEAEGDSELTSTLVDNLVIRDETAESTIELTSEIDELGIRQIVQASTVIPPPPNASLTGDADGDIIESAFLIDPYAWDFAVDYSNPSSLLAGDLAIATPGSGGLGGQPTGGFTAGAIGSSRVNQAFRNSSYEHILATTVPFTTSDSMHYRLIGRAPLSGSTRLIHSFGDLVPGNYVSTMRIEVGTSDILFRVIYSTFISPNWFAFTLATPSIATISSGDYLLIDINLTRVGANLTYDFYVNGAQSSYTFAASQRGHTPHWSEIDRSRLSDSPSGSSILFAGFVTNSTISFAQHQSDYNNSGI